ncbi:hypothetical protein D3C75_729590 [compost metagenome]
MRFRAPVLQVDHSLRNDRPQRVGACIPGRISGEIEQHALLSQHFYQLLVTAIGIGDIGNGNRLPYMLQHIIAVFHQLHQVPVYVIAEKRVMLRHRFHHGLSRCIQQQHEIRFLGTGGNQASTGGDLILQRFIEEAVFEERGDECPLHRRQPWINERHCSSSCINHPCQQGAAHLVRTGIHIRFKLQIKLRNPCADLLLVFGCMPEGGRVILREDQELNNPFLHQLQHQLIRFNINAPPCKIIIQYLLRKAGFNLLKLLQLLTRCGSELFPVANKSFAENLPAPISIVVRLLIGKRILRAAHNELKGVNDQLRMPAFEGTQLIQPCSKLLQLQAV